MIYCIIFIAVFFTLFVIFSKKYKNPYKLIYLLGAKGAGKSTYMIREMIKHLKAGHEVYTDMPGVEIPGVRFTSISEIAKTPPPPDSAVFLDEVGLSVDCRSFKSFPPELRDYAALQRHYKNYVYLNSQSFDCDKKLRDRCDKFYFLQKFAIFWTIIRPIHQVIKANDDPHCENPCVSTYKFGSLFSIRFVFIPAWSGMFDSFYCPRESVSIGDPFPGTFAEWYQERRFRARMIRAMKRRFSRKAP